MFPIPVTCFPSQSLIMLSWLLFTAGEEQSESLAGMNRKPQNTRQTVSSDQFQKETVFKLIYLGLPLAVCTFFSHSQLYPHLNRASTEIARAWSYHQNHEGLREAEYPHLFWNTIWQEGCNFFSPLDVTFTDRLGNKCSKTVYSFSFPSKHLCWATDNMHWITLLSSPSHNHSF